MNEYIEFNKDNTSVPKTKCYR